MRKFFWRCAPQRLRHFLAVWMASSSAGNGAGSSEHRSEDECTEPINEEPEKHKSTKKNANKRIKLDFDNMPLKEKRSYYRCGERFITLDSILTWPDYVKNNCKTFLKEGLFKRQPEFCSEHDKVNRKVSLWQGDITCLEIDAIVNAANRTLRGGGGVDGCIHRAAGRELLQECITLNGCDTGRAKITSGHRLPAKKVIHTVGPIGENETKLQSCYKSCLKLVEEHNLSTVAFCCISTGVYGYPPEKAARVALQTVKEWLGKNEHKVDRIIFCVFLPEDLYIYEKLMLKYFPCTVIKDESEDEETESAAEGKKDSRGNAQPVEELEMMNISPQIQNVSNNVSGSKEKERSVKTDGDTKGDTEEGLSTTASDMAQLTRGLTGEDAGALEDTGDQVGSPEDSANKEPIKGERERCGDVADKEVVAKDSVGESIMAVSAVDEKKKEDVTDVTMNKEGESKDRDQSASESSSMAVDEAVVAKASVVEDTMAASAVDEKKEEDEDVTGVRMNEDGESKDRDESASESSSMAVEEVVVAKGAIGEGTMAASAVDEKEEDVTRVRMNKEGETKDRNESASGSSSMAVDEMVVANGAVGEGTMAASAMNEKEEDVTRVRMNKEGESKDRDESASGSSSMAVDEVVVANGAVGEGTMAASALDEKEEDVTRVRMNKEGESKDRDESASGSSSMAVGEVVGAKGAVGEGTMAVCAMGEKKDNDVTDVRMNKECETKDRRESASGSSSMARDEVVEEKDDTQETKGMKKEEKKEDGEEQMDADNKTTEDAEEMVTDADQEAGTETDL